MDVMPLIIVLLSVSAQTVLQTTGKFIFFAWVAIAAVIAHGVYFFGTPILYLLLLTYITSTIAELVSLKTPIYCFGVKYWYNISNKFFSSRINLLGVYPLEVSLAWVILKYCSFIVALLISQAFYLPQIITIVLPPAILVSLDFIIDPLAVHESKLWQWKHGSKYFGIPVQNFVGWYLVGLVISFLFTFAYGKTPITFHILHVIPVVLYATFLQKISQLMKLDRRMAIIGSLPAILWTILGSVSLYLLHIRSV